MDKAIGNFIKNLRKSRNITLQYISEKTGLSVSYISMVERGLTNITMANLQKICNAFNITLSTLVSSLENEKLHVKGDERKIVFDEEKGIVLESASEIETDLGAIFVRLQNDEVHKSSSHVSTEIGYVIAGSMSAKIGDSTYLLQPGDTLIVPAHMPHELQKVSEEDCTSIWVYNNIINEHGQNARHVLQTTGA